MPLNMIFKGLGLLLAVVGLIDTVMDFLPANIIAMVPAQLHLTQGFAQGVSVFASGAVIYLLAEVAAKRVPKSY